MTYVKNIYVKSALYFVVLLIACTNCRPSKVFSTNVPNYSIVAEGNSNKPGILLFVDPSVEVNDSIVHVLEKEYYVIKVEKKYADAQRRMNEDHPLLRSTEANMLLADLEGQHRIVACGATGLEVPGNLNWMVNTDGKKLLLFPTHLNSIEDHIKQCMFKEIVPLNSHQQEHTALELYELLSSEQNPSGQIGTYSIRFVKSIWKLQPTLLLQAYEGELEYKKIR